MSKKNGKRKWWQLHLGSMSDLKAGTAAGAEVRDRSIKKITGGKSEKPGQWLKDRGRGKSDEWIAERVSKTKARMVSAAGLVVLAWLWLSAWSGFPLYVIVLGCISIVITMRQAYKWMVKKVREGKEEQ